MTFDLLLIGVAITIEPIPLSAFLLILLSRNGARKGAAFVAGWILSLAVIVVVTVLVTGNKPPRPNTAPSLAALAAKIAIGVVLLGIAERRRRRLGRPKPPKKTPKWQTLLDDMSLWYAAALAVLVQPWGLVAAGAAEITEAKITSVQSSIALVLFYVVATGLYLGLECFVLRRPERAHRSLNGVRTWIDGHTDWLIIWVSLGLGLWLIGNSAYLLATG